MAGVERLSVNATDCSTTVPDRWVQQKVRENYTEISVITFTVCHGSCYWRNHIKNYEMSRTCSKNDTREADSQYCIGHATWGSRSECRHLTTTGSKAVGT